MLSIHPPRLLSLSLCLLSFSCLFPASAKTLDSHSEHTNTQVTLPLSEVTLHYPLPVRLDKVMGDALAQQAAFNQLHPNHASAPFPLGYKLFSLDKQDQITKAQQSITTSLNALMEDAKLAPSAQVLLAQLNQFHFAYRETTSLDYDQMRLSIENNPLLTGHYRLELTTRPSSVFVLGLVKAITEVTFDANQSIAEVLKQSDLLDSASQSFVWLIYPDGHVKKVGYAHWNHEAVSLTPGTLLFVGFHHPNKTQQTLELDMAQLFNQMEISHMEGSL